MLSAKNSFAGTVGGRRFVITRGQTIDDNHPIVQRYPDKFTSSAPDFPAWESATRAPNEVRTLVLNHLPVDEDMPLKDLQEIASGEGLPTYGTKSDIVERINKKRGQ